jgi:uncharacterized protein DUF1877
MNGLLIQISPELLHALRRAPRLLASIVDGSDAANEGAAARLTLEKAAHGVSYLLYGAANPFLGGRKLGDDPAYGPARFFTPTQVRDLVAALGRLPPDTVEQRFDAGRMTAESRPWLFAAVDDVRAFYRDAAAAGRAVLVCVVANGSASARSAGGAH